MGYNQREIEFRVWNNDKKKMYYQSPFMSYHLYYMTLDGLIYDKGKYQEQLILTQYTGLKDKNGIKIYEGDIISHKSRGKYIARRIIKWNKYSGFDLPGNLETVGSPWILIGNIFENPELIQEEFMVKN